MKFFLVLSFLPAFVYGQSNFYFTADGGVNFAKSIQHTGYSFTGAGNIYISDRFSLGVSTGFVKLQPFTTKLSVPLSLRMFFFTSGIENKVAPFVLLEGGKLFYKEENFGGNTHHTFKGKHHFFGGVGIKIRSEERRLEPFTAIGYSSFFYIDEIQSEPQSPDGEYHLQRLLFRIGVMF